MTSPTKWTREAIKTRLETDTKWLVRGLLAIYNRQPSLPEINSLSTP